MTREERDKHRARGQSIAGDVGGPVDETHVTLGIYGTDLQPEEISAVLGCAPTFAHRRGDVRRPGTPAWPQGAWLLTVHGRPPAGPDELVRDLLDRLPKNPAIWEQLAAKYTMRVTFAVFVVTWNSGFELSPESVKQLAMLGVPVGFEIYAEGEEERSAKD